MTTIDRAALGKSNRNKGARAERDLVNWLRDHGWPGAERAVRTGYRTTTRTSVDPGDVTGTPGIVWQVKHSATFDEPAKLAHHLADTDQQREAANADYGILVQRRTGYPDPGEWFAWVGVDDLHRLTAFEPTHHCPDLLRVPARVLLGDLVPLLYSAGYGTPNYAEAADVGG